MVCFLSNKMKLIRQIGVPLITFVICLTFFHQWTQGFSSFTIYSYTLKRADPVSKPFPDFKLLSHRNQLFQISEMKKYKLVNFVYLNCPYVCHKVNNQLEGLYHLIDTTIVPSQLELVTISFDLEHDDVERIRKYRALFGTDIEGWTFALPHQVKENDFFRDLKEIGVWINRDPVTGLINHSVNLFLVDPSNKIVRIFDPGREEIDVIIEQINQCIREERIS